MGLKDALFSKNPPAWVRGADMETCQTLDLRPLLAGGEEPLGAVTELAERIAPGGIMMLEAPFDPVPLRRLLVNLGFEDFSENLAEKHVRIWLRRAGAPGVAETEGADEAKIYQDGEIWHVEARGLGPPKPMLAILSLVDTPAVSGPIVIHLDREPVNLYPDLEERGWTWSPLDGEAGEVRLRLEKKAP